MKMLYLYSFDVVIFGGIKPRAASWHAAGGDYRCSGVCVVYQHQQTVLPGPGCHRRHHHDGNMMETFN